MTARRCRRVIIMRSKHLGRAAVAGTLLLMPAWRSGEALGVKIVTVFPDNAGRALPSVHGT